MVALGVAAALLLAASASALAISHPPKSGRYSGFVQFVYQISFRVSSNGKTITGLQTDFQPPCGVLSPSKIVTRFPSTRIANGHFRVTKPHGLLTISGHFSPAGAASGKVTGQEALTGFTPKPRVCKISAPFSVKRVGS